MSSLGLSLLGISVAFVAYTYAVYPLLLLALGKLRPVTRKREGLDEWPFVTITLAAYNEAATIRETIENLLRLDYPADRRHILVVSDGSTDGTDRIVAQFGSHGVELLRMPERGGKDAAENAALPQLRGSIIVNTDASVRIQPNSLKPLISAFADSSVGLASGRDVSVGGSDRTANLGESKYVGFEMWIRRLETRVCGIVGASGCFYAVREEVHRRINPRGTSRDFAAVLVARQKGYRSVSVDEAVCLVPRQGSPKREYARKVRTMARGLRTMLHLRALLNPFRYGLFAWILFSHKLCRWLVPWTLLVGLLGLAALVPTEPWARWAFGGVLLVSAVALVGLNWPKDRKSPSILALPTYLVMGNLAALHAWARLLQGRSVLWEPTRRVDAKIG